ncbi:MAG TPA: hypothetical protein VLH16_04440, partial [Bacteroidales bacterium]|nr:hypothetical protein [Bacteroidales bacterium]
MKTTLFDRGVILVALYSISLCSIAQTRIISPYSRFGIGDLHQSNHATILGMGGTNAAFSMPGVINNSNPASYAAFLPQTFLFDVALTGRLSDLQTTTLRQSTNHLALGHILMGFPVTQHWKASVGVV